MKKFLLIAVCAGVLLAACETNLTQYVNPLVGTDFHGHTYPGAIAPYGQIQPSPDTRLEGWDGCSAYHYSDDTIYGFSHTHLNGTGCEDYGDILLMPVMAPRGRWTFSPDMPQEEYCSQFSHRSEKAAPGYYRVVLDHNRVMVELTASRRVACQRYTFPSSDPKGFIIDLRHRDQVLNTGLQYDKENGLITGWRESNAWNPRQKCFFALTCNRPIKEVKYYANKQKALVVLDDNCKNVEVYVALSGVDCDGAVQNLATRGDDDFVALRSQTRRLWEKMLSKVEVQGGSRKEKKNFYTALYHCYTSPYLWSDVDGRYRGMNDSILSVDRTPSGKPAHEVYTVFSLWDTYRALHPLMTILEPNTTEDWIYTMLKQYETGGELTMWELSAYETHCMIGYHACPVILEAYRAGVLDKWRPQEKLELLTAMTVTANRTEEQQAYASQGYMDSQVDNESVSKTVEYSYDDWCIATYAQALATDPQMHLSDSAANWCKSVYAQYMRRANSWRNLMDAQGFMHARRNGGFTTPFDPTEVNNHYTEANSWQYSTYVPHDVKGWIAMMGGEKKAESFLDSLFNSNSETSGRDQSDITGMVGQYAQGNEPSHHAAYLYAYVGAPEKLDATVHQILDDLYSPYPDGLCGNEDCGQMSAWYVMSAMGFYPLCPGSGEYVTCTPLFDKITIHREGQPDLVIDKSQWQPGKFWHNEELCDTSANLFDSQQIVPPAPYFENWQPRFEDSTFVTLHTLAAESSSNVTIYYTLNGLRPDTNSIRYTTPILLKNDAIINAVSYDKQHGYSNVVCQKLKRYVADKRLRYITKPAPQYSENGPDGLIDKIYGSTNYRIGGWQGWQNNMEVVIDLLQNRTVTSVGVDCLENMRSWIFFPKHIEVSLSNDGKNFTPWGATDNTEFEATSDRQEESVQHTFTCQGSWTSARYVKVKVINYGPLPEWHISAGEPAWLFVDEIEVGTYIPTFFSVE